MKGIRFYEEFRVKPAKPAGTVVAVFEPAFSSQGKVCFEAVSGVFHYPNSPVTGTAVSREYLKTSCRRVSEKRARKIHPLLFERLDH